MAASDALPLPRKNVAFRLYFTARTSAGALVTAFTAPDSEVSKDGGAYADCTSEATFVGRGLGYIDLTSTEMNADSVAFYFACTEGEIESPVIIYPAETGDILASPAIIKTTIATLISQTSFRLAAGPAEDDALKGCEILIVDSADPNQMTIVVCSGYSGSTKQVTTSLTTPTFTIAVSDNVSVMMKAPISSTTPGRSLEIDNAGLASANSFKIGGTTQSAVDIGGRLGAPAGASVSADIAAVKADTAAILDDTGTTGVVVASASIGDIGFDVWAGASGTANVAKIDAILDDTGTTGVVVAAASKSGYALSSTGLDSIATTAPTGVASNFREMVVQTWRRFFKKAVHDTAAETLKTYADDGTTVITTQALGTANDVETQGPAT